MWVAYFEKGCFRSAKNWQEVNESICDRWDSCSPCSYANGYNTIGGGFNCSHPLNPKNDKGVNDGIISDKNKV